jgi:hypothetical protein
VKKLLLTLAVFILCSCSFAQTSAFAQRQAAAALSQQRLAVAAAVASPFATSACAYNFTSGTADTFLKFCATVNGNITQLETPQGHEHIAVGAFGEGYSVCDESTHPAVGYFDYADFGDSGTWGPPTLLNQTATSVKIARTSTDGVWTLTQTITDVASTGAINVAMTVKNNSTSDRFASLMRYADVDADGTFLNSFDETARTAFGWQASDWGVINSGIQIQNVGTTPFQHAAVSHNSPAGPTCTQPANVGTETQTDGSIVMIYFLGTVAHGKSVSVTTAYKGF